MKQGGLERAGRVTGATLPPPSKLETKIALTKEAQSPGREAGVKGGRLIVNSPLLPIQIRMERNGALYYTQRNNSHFLLCMTNHMGPSAELRIPECSCRCKFILPNILWQKPFLFKARDGGTNTIVDLSHLCELPPPRVMRD